MAGFSLYRDHPLRGIFPPLIRRYLRNLHLQQLRIGFELSNRSRRTCLITGPARPSLWLTRKEKSVVPTPTMPINRMIGSNYNNSPSPTIYSDRFIPSRFGTNFALFDLSNSPASDQGKENRSIAYQSLLRATLFGPDTPGYDESGPSISHSPVKAPRKVPTSPLQVTRLPSCVIWGFVIVFVQLVGLNVELTLLFGTNNGQVQIWDASNWRRVRTMERHRSHVGVLAWSSSLLSSGSYDKSILQRDMHARDDFARDGATNRCIRFWDTTTNTHLSCMDTGSQISNLVWSKNVNELVSTHGSSQDHIIVWRCPTMSKLATLTGHTTRVLYLAISPDEQKIVTGSGDETLCFWKLFPASKSQNANSKIGASSFGRTTIR
ncbi:hypothetical protein J1N35_033419 [Gossypium stocksii]|uniref:Anaphase-promoting complex subunit 4 WD40 domain-containing protein n=1 Tax=Gossypium stocksii TaxID=47602 RepID=A0A9D3URZ9_9ROSI|nr:hypothetical protein J1N35_033419 [Gossypium stocksii]